MLRGWLPPVADLLKSRRHEPACQFPGFQPAGQPSRLAQRHGNARGQDHIDQRNRRNHQRQKHGRKGWFGGMPDSKSSSCTGWKLVGVTPLRDIESASCRTNPFLLFAAATLITRSRLICRCRLPLHKLELDPRLEAEAERADAIGGSRAVGRLKSGTCPHFFENFIRAVARGAFLFPLQCKRRPRLGTSFFAYFCL